MSDTAQGPGWYRAADGKWYPPQIQPPPPSRRKRSVFQKGWFWVLVVVVLGFGGCIAVVGGGTAAIDSANHQKHTVVYQVTGAGTGVTIGYNTWDNSHGGSATASGVTLPWTKKVVGSGLFSVYQVTVTLGPSGGSATCSVTVDGDEVTTNGAGGPFGIATCSAGS
jgi:hypothetical protein